MLYDVAVLIKFGCMQMYSKSAKNDTPPKEIYDTKIKLTKQQLAEIQQDYLIFTIKILRFLICFSY